MEDLELPVKSQDDIEDFEQWEPISNEAEPVNLLESISNGQQVEVFTPTHSLEEVKSLDSPVSDLDSFSSDPKKVAFPLLLLSRLGLSKIEQGGVLAFFVLLLLCGLFAYAFSINRIPTDSGDAKPLHFPIKGAHVILDNAVTYWRAPIIDGPSPDVFRRGMVLLPIVELKVLSGHGAIRVSFIDENQRSIGDMVTREVSEKGVLKVVGTAGYEELGMFTAYRTGDKKPWTIKVLEGPSVDAKSNEFKELFEMNLSSETR